MPKRVKLLLIAMTAVALGIFVSLAWVGGGGEGCTTPDAIVRVMPDCNESVLGQAPIEVEVENGYRAELTINGVQIPSDELQTNVGGNDIGVGVTPTVYRFVPGEGKTVEQLDPNLNCAIVSYYPVARGIEEARDFQWCFRAA
jgi:hypothetical protein